MRVAIIDNGVAQGDWKLHKSVRFDPKAEAENGTLVPVTADSHGTNCLRIIRHLIGEDEDIDWYDLNIFTTPFGAGKIGCLSEALDYCLAQHIQVIHMSVGTADFRDEPLLGQKIRKLAQIGCIMVAANNNMGTATYPARFRQVIGVACDKRLAGGAYTLNPNAPYDGIDFIAGAIRILDNGDVIEHLDYANSYAAPVITAYCIGILRENPDASPNIVRALLAGRAWHSPQNDTAYYGLLADMDTAALLDLCPPDVFQPLPNPKYLELIREIFVLLPGQSISSALYEISSAGYCSLIIRVPYVTILDELLIIQAGALFPRGVIIYPENTNTAPLLPYTVPANVAIYRPAKPTYLCEITAASTEKPVVLLAGYPLAQGFALLYELKKLFRARDYHALPALEHPLARAGGLEVLPQGIALGEYIRTTAAFFSCDILLLFMQESGMPAPDGDVTIYIVSRPGLAPKIDENQQRVLVRKKIESQEIFEQITQLLE